MSNTFLKDPVEKNSHYFTIPSLKNLSQINFWRAPSHAYIIKF